MPELPELPAGWRWGVYKHIGDGHTVDGYTLRASHMDKGAVIRLIQFDKLTGSESSYGVLNGMFWDILDSIEILEREYSHRDIKRRVTAELTTWLEDHLTPNGG